MATLRDIKNRISSVKSTSKITSAMKMVAAAKLKRAQSNIEQARPYFNKLEDMMSNLVSALGSSYNHFYLAPHNEVKHIAVIVVSSDRGLCGGFNAALFREAAKVINTDLKKEHPGAKVSVITVGKKAVTYFKKRNYNILAEYPGIFQDLDFEIVKNILNPIAEEYQDLRLDKVLICYNKFVTTVVQRPSTLQVLPLEPAQITDTNQAFSVNYIFEPSEKEILDELIPKIVDIKLWKSLLESNAAEQAARMVAMDKATTNARDLVNVLELQYNKARQAAITTEMLEIVGGADALKAS